MYITCEIASFEGLSVYQSGVVAEIGGCRSANWLKRDTNHHSQASGFVR